MTKPTASSSPMFRDFTVDEYEIVLELLEQKSYSKGDVILVEGKSEQALWILVQGSCEVVKKNKSKAEKQLAKLESGAVFGEMSFLQEAPHSATVRACSAVRLMRMTRDSYERLHTRCPTAAYKITLSVVSLLSERLRRMDDWICSFIERPEEASHREEWHDFRAKLYADLSF